MAGRIVRLVLVGLVLLGCWRLGQAYMDHYRLADELDRIASRGVRTDEAEVRRAIEEAVARLAAPVDPRAISVRVEAEHVYIDARYTRPVEILPGYRYAWSFTSSSHGWVVPTGGVRAR